MVRRFLLLLVLGWAALFPGVPGLTAAGEPVDWEAAARFWSFQAPVRHPAESSPGATWVRHPIDAFILAELKAAGLEPNPEAEARTLFRRVSFDLTGLPPEPATPTAYDAYVENLLASPAFGERWARLWLDVARYAEDQAHIVGNNASLTYPNAWLYRDWVIAALNADLPYDAFIREQLAADFLHPDEPETHAALGFMGLGPKYYRRGDLAVMADEWEDRVDTLSRGVLALTVACARCHDHFFDPIPTSDYHALAGVFASTELFNRPLEEGCEMQADGQAKQPQDAAHLVREAKTPRHLPVYQRGDVTAPGEEVPRGFLTVLGGGKRLEFDPATSGRLDLANALAGRDNPLTARVWVNRVWGELFGQSLVATPSNFGALGSRPSHPELLDDLAVRFMDEGGWSLKWLVREIVLSATYRQSSAASPDQLAADPANRLLGRMNRRRLPVEMWRDALFTASGTLDRTVGGPSFDASSAEANRRAIYARVSRLQLDPMLAIFDFPDPNLHSPGRSETTTPLQRLFVINHPLVVGQAATWATRLESSAASPADRVTTAYRDLFARTPLPEELALGRAYLERNSTADYAQVLLASNEFGWLD